MIHWVLPMEAPKHHVARGVHPLPNIPPDAKTSQPWTFRTPNVLQNMPCKSSKQPIKHGISYQAPQAERHLSKTPGVDQHKQWHLAKRCNLACLRPNFVCARGTSCLITLTPSTGWPLLPGLGLMLHGGRCSGTKTSGPATTICLRVSTTRWCTTLCGPRTSKSSLPMSLPQQGTPRSPCRCPTLLLQPFSPGGRPAAGGWPLPASSTSGSACMCWHVCTS